MVLRVGFVETLEQVVEPVISHLTSTVDQFDLFETQHLIVPTAGVRAWLAPQLASRIGSAPGATDGILSNVRIGYVGMLNAILRGGIEDESDPWSIERLTMAVLRVIRDRPSNDPLVKKYGGHLRAARAMADRFDRYANRRPQLIRQWESAFLSGDEVGRDNSMVESQYALWSAVREVVGVPPWPSRSAEICRQLKEGGSVPGLPRRLMVAGLETVSAGNLEILQALGQVIDVDVLFVHPSPYLHDEWASIAKRIPVTPGHAPARSDDAHVLPAGDSMVTTWLRGAFELQSLLESQGVADIPYLVGGDGVVDETLLARLKKSVVSPHAVAPQSLAKDDLSVQIHRAHNLARQVEVLRDALLHAFNDLKDLRPHEVLILCADIEAAAPLLRATFDQPLSLSGGGSVKIPLVVADRSLRDVNSGAELLVNVLSLIGSRFDVPAVLRVASHDLVLGNLGLGEDDVETWLRYIETTRVRWGLDVEQRATAGLDAPQISAHTWKQALDRALLGALLPDAAVPAHELGGVVPLANMDTAEISALTGLSEVMATIARLDVNARGPRPVSFWCREIADVLVDLCGESCTDIDDALAVITGFEDSTRTSMGADVTELDDDVRFEEFADMLVQKLSTTPGHQPLRTGAVTATSFVPLRSVPFRVICVVGLDEGTLTVGEAEGDDIVAAEPLMGDPDPRIDQRRVLLDALTAARDRLIFTCNGRSIKNNSKVPMVTPLAELLDLCGRLGVVVPEDPEKPSAIEHFHPRHSSGHLNFVSSKGPIEGLTWSHDQAALMAARDMGLHHDDQPASDAPTLEPYDEVPLRKLEALLIDPLQYYLRESLRIFTEYEEDDPGSVLPLSMTEFELARAAEALVKASDGGSLDLARDAWRAAVEASDALPVGKFGVDAAQEAFDVAKSVRMAADTVGIPKADPDPIEFKVTFDNGVIVDCAIPNVVGTPDGDLVYVVRYDTRGDKDLVRIALRLLALRASGRSIKSGVVVLSDTTNLGHMMHVVTLDPSLTVEAARDQLRALAEVEPFARVVPCGRFGDASSALADAGTLDDDDVLEKFDDFVESHGFANSSEFTVFGAHPRIEDVYSPSRGDIVGFFRVHGSTCVLEAEGNKAAGVKKWVMK